MDFFLAFIISLLFAGLCAHFAKKQGRDPVIWFLVGLVIGVFGLLILFLFPKKTAEEEAKSSTEVEGDKEIEGDPAFDSESYDIAHEEPQISNEGIFFQKEWYYFDQEKKQQGPVGISILRAYWKEEKIDKDTFVWSENMANWQKVNAVPQLEQYLEGGMTQSG